ncbi:MAG: hypothetical protein AAF219_09500, partial [Myxococcota bacterium]
LIARHVPLLAVTRTDGRRMANERLLGLSSGTLSITGLRHRASLLTGRGVLRASKSLVERAEGWRVGREVEDRENEVLKAA